MRKYFRFIGGFRRFTKARMEPQEAATLGRTFIKKRVRAREENFLNLAEKGIFQYSDSPYRKLLERPRIQFDDLKRWVSRDGIEAGLRILEQAGVYFTVDEFKGRVPIVRGGFRL